MSYFRKMHYVKTAYVIGEWIRLNPNLREEHIQSLINGFILLFKTDSNRFDRYRFDRAIQKNRQPHEKTLFPRISDEHLYPANTDEEGI